MISQTLTGERHPCPVVHTEHYVFNPRDLTAWILSLLRYEVASNEALYEAQHQKMLTRKPERDQAYLARVSDIQPQSNE
eukprot:3113832-Amphidinium_carterae.1